MLTRDRRVALADRRRRAREVDAAGLLHAALGRPRSASRSSRWRARCAWSCRASSSPTSRCPCSPRTRAPPPRSPRRWRPRSTPRTSCAPCSCTSPSAAGCGWRAGMDHEIEGPEGYVTAVESHDDLGRVDGHRRHRARRAAEGRQAPRLRLVERALAAVGARPGRRRAGGRAQVRLRRARRGAARLPRRLLGPRGRRARGRPRAPAGRALLRSSTRCRPAPAPSSARSRPRASPAPATTATRSGTPRRSCCRCSPTPCPTRPPTRCAGAGRRSTSPSSARRRCTSRAPRSRGARSAGRSARATGRRAPPRSTSTRASRRR